MNGAIESVFKLPGGVVVARTVGPDAGPDALLNPNQGIFVGHRFWDRF